MHTNASNANVGCIHGKQGKPCLTCSRDQKRLSRAQETGGDLCVVSPRYNPSIWLLGCDRKEEIRTQHPRTSQLLYPYCVAEIFHVCLFKPDD
jgi:hypothetical protein